MTTYKELTAELEELSIDFRDELIEIQSLVLAAILKEKHSFSGSETPQEFPLKHKPTESKEIVLNLVDSQFKTRAVWQMTEIFSELDISYSCSSTELKFTLPA